MEITKESIQNKVIQAENLSKEWSSDSYRRSIDLFNQASQEWKSIGAIQEYSNCLRQYAKIYYKLNDYKNAETVIKKAISADTQLRFSDGVSEDYSLLSLINLRSGNIKESEYFYKQALLSSNDSSNPHTIALAMFSAAQYSYNYDNAENTIKLFQQTLTFAEKSGDKDLAAQCLLYLGFTHIKLGNSIKSSENAQAALAIWQQLDDKRGQAICLVGLGFIHTILSQKQEALNYYKRGENLFPNDFEWLEKGKLFNGLATVFDGYNQPKLSEIYRHKALESFQKANYLSGQLATLPSLANVVYINGDFDTAKKIYDDALSLAHKLNDEHHLAYINKDLGKIYLEKNQPDKAISYLLNSEKIHSKLSIVFPETQNILGSAYQKKGDYNTALKYFTKALNISNKTREVLIESETLFNLAQLENSVKNHEKAINYTQNSIELTETLYSDIANSKLKSTFFSNVHQRYEFYINLLMNKYDLSKNGNDLIEALQASEKSRSRAMLENLLLTEANFIKDADPELLKNENEIRKTLNFKTDKLRDALSFVSSNQEEINKLGDEINELDSQLETIKATLKQNSPIYSGIKNTPPFDVAEFQEKILDENTILLEYSFGKEESYLWVIEKNNLSSFVLPKREILETRVQKLRELLNNRELKPDETFENYSARLAKDDNEYWQEAKLLSNDILGQISEKIKSKRLIIVPDGKLNLFPISALPFPNAENNEPILLSNEIIYEPSASILNIILANQNNKISNPKDLLMFADPVFAKDDSRLANISTAELNSNANVSTIPNLRFSESLTKLQRLPASDEEANSISEVIGNSNSYILKGFFATRDRIFTPEINQYKILHFATHGLINQERPEVSSIALSQFNEQGENLDGEIRLQDIYSLNLNSDLVVLSACETGIGKEIKGEGLMSLNNAFLQVGAKSVVSSLWKVDDQATKELMKYFYQELATGKTTTSESLRKAQIKMFNNPQFKSPFYWAAFTIQGDHKNITKLSTSNSNNWIYLIITTVLLLIGIGYLGYKKYYSTIKL